MYAGRVIARVARPLSALPLVERALYAAAAVADVAITWWRWTFITAARHAGHADPSFYYDTARNLARGRGLTSDYVWEFLTLPPQLHHYAAEYWQPLPSILMSVPMLLTGDHSVTAALSASIIAAALVPVSAGLLAYRLTGRHHIGALTALVIALLPRLSFWSVQTESVTFFMLFAVTAMAFASGRSESRRRWFAAAACAAAAYLCRNDGGLLLVMLAIPLALPVLRSRGAPRAVVLQRLRLVGFYFLGAALVLTPSLVANLVYLHRLLPPTAKVAYLNSYEQLFAVNPPLSLGRLLSRGLGSALRYRWSAAKDLLTIFREAFGRPAYRLLVGLAAVNVVALRRRPARVVGTARVVGPARAGWLVLAGTAVLAFGFEAVVIPIAALGGTWDRSLLAYFPLLVIAALAGASRIPAGAFVAGAVLVVVSSAQVSGGVTPAQAVARNNTAGDLVGTYSRYLVPATPGGPVVVMTRDPWQVTEVTGHPSVMIPDDGVCTVESIAKRYGATVFVTAPQRPAFTDTFLAGKGFVLLGGTGLHDVFRIPATIPGC